MSGAPAQRSRSTPPSAAVGNVVCARPPRLRHAVVSCARTKSATLRRRHLRQPGATAPRQSSCGGPMSSAPAHRSCATPSSAAPACRSCATPISAAARPCRLRQPVAAALRHRQLRRLAATAPCQCQLRRDNVVCAKPAGLRHATISRARTKSTLPSPRKWPTEVPAVSVGACAVGGAKPADGWTRKPGASGGAC
jgi:hypothetical protein